MHASSENIQVLQELVTDIVDDLVGRSIDAVSMPRRKRPNDGAGLPTISADRVDFTGTELGRPMPAFILARRAGTLAEAVLDRLDYKAGWRVCPL
jgi:hypothetical protein